MTHTCITIPLCIPTNPPATRILSFDHYHNIWTHFNLQEAPFLLLLSTISKHATTQGGDRSKLEMLVKKYTMAQGKHVSRHNDKPITHTYSYCSGDTFDDDEILVGNMSICFLVLQLVVTVVCSPYSTSCNHNYTVRIAIDRAIKYTLNGSQWHRRWEDTMTNRILRRKKNTYKKKKKTFFFVSKILICKKTLLQTAVDFARQNIGSEQKQLCWTIFIYKGY